MDDLTPIALKFDLPYFNAPSSRAILPKIEAVSGQRCSGILSEPIASLGLVGLILKSILFSFKCAVSIFLSSKFVVQKLPAFAINFRNPIVNIFYHI